MLGKKITGKTGTTGNATLEYAILLPTVFACVFAVITVFLVLTQKALIQNLAEDTAETLSRQWGYMSFLDEEMKSGIYKKTTYKEREIYWNLKLWNNEEKEKKAERYIKKRVIEMGPLKTFQPQKSTEGNQKNENSYQDPSVLVKYTADLPSTLTVEIVANYIVPGAGVMKLLGMGDFLTIKGSAQGYVYDAKDMINTTDYVIQIFQGTKTYQLFMEKVKPLKDNLQKIIKK